MPDYYRRLRQCMQALDEKKREELHLILDLINSGIPALA
jgi:hypothetical protein